MTGGASVRLGYRPDIDGLRAVSILLVVGFHAGFDALAGGYVGVDVFFVISGFLITSLLIAEQERTSRISLRDFYARRARRLLPLAFLTILCTLVAGYALAVPLRRSELVRDAIASSLYFANWRFAGQSVAYSDSEVTESLFLHFWSLSVEEQFYAVWPLLVVGAVAVARKRGWGARPVLGFAIGGVSAVSLAVSVIASYHSPDAYYFTHTRIWELGVGAGLAIAGQRMPILRRGPAEALAAAGLGMIVAAALVYDDTTVFPGYTALLPVLGCAAVIVAGHSQRGLIRRLLGASPMTYIGRLSYAWYLWHWPAVGLAALAARRLGYEPNPTLVLGAVAVSFGAAAASHHLVEQPIRHSQGLARRPARALAMAACLTTLPVFVGVTLDATRPETAVAAAEGASAGEASSTVAMTPEEAAADEVTMQAPECHSRFPEVDVSPDCLYGDPDGDPTVVLVGDSHAQHWLPALDAGARSRGWRVLAWTKSSCTPIDVPLRNDRLEREYRECYEWREKVREAVASLGGADVVVVADSYRYTEMMIGPDGESVEPARAAELWKEGAARTFEAYEDTAGVVVLLRDTPWAHRSIPECLSEDPSTPGRCSFSLDGRIHLDEAFVGAELEAAPASVEVVDMTDAVCETDPCQVVTSEGVIKYRDSHHLTQTFSRRLADALMERLEDVAGAAATVRGG